MISKSALLYVFRPDSKYTCGECVFYSEGECALFTEDDEKVSATSGGCNLYVQGYEGAMPDLPFVTKQEAGYIEHEGGFTCGKCRYFNAERSACQVVDKNSPGDTPGRIVAGGCCNNWEESAKAMKPEDLRQITGDKYREMVAA